MFPDLRKLDLSVSGLRIIAISFIMVTLDILTTRYGLNISDILYERNMFGNIPIIEYSTCVGMTYLLYRYEKHFNMKHIISLFYALFPVVAVVNNLFFIFISL